MTRANSKKSLVLTTIMAIVVLMTLGVTDIFGDHEVDFLVHEFGVLLEGVEAEILRIPDDTRSSEDTTNTMQIHEILSEIAYVHAFDEVIHSQIL